MEREDMLRRMGWGGPMRTWYEERGQAIKELEDWCRCSALPWHVKITARVMTKW